MQVTHAFYTFTNRPNTPLSYKCVLNKFFCLLGKKVHNKNQAIFLSPNQSKEDKNGEESCYISTSAKLISKVDGKAQPVRESQKWIANSFILSCKLGSHHPLLKSSRAQHSH